jgi:CubicO group peptidase (beta-lactamase class C family)
MLEVRSRFLQPAIAAAILLEDGRTLREAVGVRRQGESAPVTVEDRFPIASCVKPMTAALVALLVDQGHLRFGTRLEQLVGPDELHPAWRHVTIADLLGHRAGLPVWDDLETDLAGFAASGSPAEDRRRLAVRLLSAAPTALPGEFAYSNAGYLVLAHLLERRLAIDFETLLRDLLWRPLGMAATDFGWPDGFQGHRDWDAWPVEEPPWIPACLHSAGSVTSSLEDLLRFGRWFLDQQLAAPADARAFQELWRIDPAAPAGYALGIGWRGAPQRRVFWHNGSSGASFAQISFAPAAGRFAIVLTNAASGRLACEGLTEYLLWELEP